jgi:hypothetical protein
LVVLVPRAFQATPAAVYGGERRVVATGRTVARFLDPRRSHVARRARPEWSSANPGRWVYCVPQLNMKAGGRVANFAGQPLAFTSGRRLLRNGDARLERRAPRTGARRGSTGDLTVLGTERSRTRTVACQSSNPMIPSHNRGTGGTPAEAQSAVRDCVHASSRIRDAGKQPGPAPTPPPERR